MPEEFTTSEGGAQPSTETANAAGDSAGQQAIETGQAAPASTAEELSAGWTFDEQPEQQSAIPDGDDDLQGMMSDPNLDQTKTPGLVEAIKTARAEARQYKAELKQLRESSAKLEKFGGWEGIESTMGIVNGLLHTPAEGAVPFWNTLAKDAQPAYWASIETLARYAPDDLINVMRHVGVLPTEQQATGTGQLNAEDWARIPQELRATANQIPVNQLIEWLDKGTDESLLFNLQTHKELADLRGSQRSQAEQNWRQATQEAETQGKQAVDQITEQYESAHLAQLAKWQPFGPEAGEQNQQLYRAILEGAHATLLADPQWNKTYEDTVTKLQNAPMRKLNNEHFAAGADERDARAAAMRYNARLGQVMRGMISSLDSVFRDARAYRESQRSQIPQRTEISGVSSTVGSNGEPARLTKDGKVSNQWLDHMISRLPGLRSG